MYVLGLFITELFQYTVIYSSYISVQGNHFEQATIGNSYLQ